MSSPNSLHSIGDFIVPLQSVAPQSSVAATINGTGIDRFAHNLPLSCSLHQAVGAVTGTPTSFTVQTALQHSADNSTWSAYTPGGAAIPAATPLLTAANTDNSASVDLSGALRYIRAATTISFVGGSSPAALVSADVIIGGSQNLAQT